MEIFGTNISLNRNEAKDFRLENLLSFPTVSASDGGLTFYHSGLKKFYGWDTSVWIDLGVEPGASSYTLPTATGAVLGGVKVDDSTIIITNGVISASASYLASGLEAINDGNGIAWRLIGEAAGDNINRYVAGPNSIDAMIFYSEGAGTGEVPSLPFGTRSNAGINFGSYNKDNASFGTIIMGSANQTNAYANAVMFGNYHNIGYGYGDTCIGTYNTTVPSNVNSFLTAIGHNVRMTGAYGGVGIGLAIVHNSQGAVVVGTSNVPWTGSFAAANRPAFTVGIGTTTTPAARWQPLVQKDGFNVLFTGEVVATSMTKTLIDAETTGRVLVTKEWAKSFNTYTVSTLPVGVLNQTAVVTDATSPTYLGVLTGGGSVVCPVWNNGTIWVSR
jgi:hypothetical protein